MDAKKKLAGAIAVLLAVGLVPMAAFAIEGEEAAAAQAPDTPLTAAEPAEPAEPAAAESAEPVAAEPAKQSAPAKQAAPIADLATAKVKGVKAKTYTGRALTQKGFTVVCAGRTLKAGVDFTVRYKNNKNAGTAKMILKPVKGRSKHSRTVAFTIKRAPISAAKAVLAQKGYDYDGKTHRPAVKSVRFAGRKLHAGKSFTVSYKNSKGPGTAYVILKGMGNFKGKLRIPYRIARLQVRYSARSSGAWSKAVRSEGQGNVRTVGDTAAKTAFDGLKISLVDNRFSGAVRYRVHLRGGKWMSWKNEGEEAGLAQGGRAIDAVKIELTDGIAKRHDIIYRVHCQDLGWSYWAKNGRAAGTVGLDFSIDAIEVYVCKRGAVKLAPSIPTLREHVQPKLQELLSAAPSDARVILNKGELTEREKEKLEMYMNQGHLVGFIAANPETGVVISYNPDEPVFSASSIKISYATSLCKYDVPGVRSAWAQGLINREINASENEAHAILVSNYGLGPINRLIDEAGAGFVMTSSGYTTYCPRDLARMWSVIYDYVLTDTGNSFILRENMRESGSDDYSYPSAWHKAGWMDPWEWSGGIYNIGGTMDGSVYAVMSKYSSEANKVDIYGLRVLLSDIVNKPRG